MTSDQMQPAPSWLVGDYITGSSYEQIAKRYGVDVETVQAHVDYGMMVREQKLADARTWVPNKTKRKARKAINVPVTPIIEFQSHHIRVIDDRYCLGDLLDVCGLCRQNIQSIIKRIDPNERRKCQTRWEGSQVARAWFVTIEGVQQWAGSSRQQTGQQRSRRTLQAFINQQTREYTEWMPIEDLAALLGADEYDLLWWVGEPTGDEMGLECSKKNGRGAYLYRAFKPTESK